MIAALDQSSVTWRYAGDARLLPFLGRAFLLQAAHPTIAAGIAEHSNFKDDPFGRLNRSYGLVLKTVYAVDGERVGAEIRAAHRRIKGVRADGRRYHAYEPEAYFWVLATGYDTIVVTANRFLRPIAQAEQRRAYDEMRELGRRLGLRDRDMPATLARFRAWYAWMLENRIENSQTVRDVLATIRHPKPPAGFPGLLWPAPRVLGAQLAWLATVGTLTAAVRERLEVPWSAVDAKKLELVAGAYRASRLVPDRWCRLPRARTAFARCARTSGSQVGEHGQHASVVVGSRRQAKLAEDASDVALGDRA
jgi:uncharacterized protein (DUF2236 family)